MSVTGTTISISPSLSGGITFGGVAGGSVNVQSPPGITFGYGSTGALLLDVLGFVGTRLDGSNPVVAAATPASVDLTSIPDASGVTVAAARIKAYMILNWDTTDGHILKVDTSVSNGATGFTGGAAGKITVPSGYLNGATKIAGWITMGGANTTGIAIDSTHKIISLDPGANTIGYTVVALGNTV